MASEGAPAHAPAGVEPVPMFQMSDPVSHYSNACSKSRTLGLTTHHVF